MSKKQGMITEEERAWILHNPKKAELTRRPPFGSVFQVTQLCENDIYVFSVCMQTVLIRLAQAGSRLAGIKWPPGRSTSVHASLRDHLESQLQLWSRCLHLHTCESCPLRRRAQLCGSPVLQQHHWTATNPVSIAPAGPHRKMISWLCGYRLTFALMSWSPRGQRSRSGACSHNHDSDPGTSALGWCLPDV